MIGNEEVGDDWLIDDVSASSTRGVKRRRPHQFDNEPLRRTSRLTSPVRRNSYRPVSPVNGISDYNDSEECQVRKISRVLYLKFTNTVITVIYYLKLIIPIIYVILE